MAFRETVAIRVRFPISREHVAGLSLRYYDLVSSESKAHLVIKDKSENCSSLEVDFQRIHDSVNGPLKKEDLLEGIDKDPCGEPEVLQMEVISSEPYTIYNSDQLPKSKNKAVNAKRRKFQAKIAKEINDNVVKQLHQFYKSQVFDPFPLFIAYFFFKDG